MNSSDPSQPPSPDEPAGGDSAPAPPPPAAEPANAGLAWSVIGLFLFAMAFGIWGLWRAFAPAPADAALQLQVQEQRIAELEQRITDLARSDQISREANQQVQATLAERDEEIAGLRADVAFYERFVGPTAQRRGLSVHALELKPQDARTWHFTATLTQNVNQGAVNEGRATLALEGTLDGRLQQLDWAGLRQQPDAEGIAYSFKFFQRVEGDVLLPEGFKPVRVIVRLVPRGGRMIEQSFTWTEAAGSAPDEAVNGGDATP
ncbi:MAG: hypothetical protein Q4F49_04415 [Pseudoxanthomonas suwonensis]|nr:hypothetical protein [Pseudoxanthomonas suwonensis]